MVSAIVPPEILDLLRPRCWLYSASFTIV